MSKTPAQRARKHGDRAATAPTARATPARPGQPVNPTTGRSPEKAEGNAKLIIIAGLVATVFMFWYLHLLTLTQMTQLSGGLAMPDSLFAGFPPEYVDQLRGAMDADALGQLNYVHKTAGTIFPLVAGFTFLLVFGTWLKAKALRWAAFALVAAFVVVRLWGNVAVDAALAAPDAAQSALASVLVVLGWALLVLMLLGAAAAVLLSRRVRTTA